MADPVSLAALFGKALFQILQKAKGLWDQSQENREVSKELNLFIEELQHNIQVLRTRSSSHENTSTWAIETLHQDLRVAAGDAENILSMKKGRFRLVLSANEVKSKLQSLRERVMISFQTKLLIATLDVALHSEQQQQLFQEALERVQVDMMEAYNATSGLAVLETKLSLRRDLQNMCRPLISAMEAQGHRFEEAMSIVRATRAQTDDTEKFLADVLAGLEDARRGNDTGQAQHKASTSRDVYKWYQDPITWDTMCDPVKGSDGRTYDRWTLIDNSTSMQRSPFDRRQDGPPLTIALPDVDGRSRLFHKFPEQEAKCRARRKEYRERALHTARQQGFYGEALVMLNHVLAWAEDDAECRARRDEIQQQLRIRIPAEETGTLGKGTSAPVPSAPPAAPPSVWQMQSSFSDDESTDSEPEEEDSSGDSASNHLLVHLNTAGCNPRQVSVSQDQLSVTYRRRRNDDATPPVVAFQTNLPCSALLEFPCYFYEVDIEDRGESGCIAVGFSTAPDFKPDALPGLYAGSWAYHGHTGMPFGEKDDSDVSARGPTFEAGNTIGAGFMVKSQRFFFTRNGEVLAMLALSSPLPAGSLFPTVGLQSRRSQVTLNFGRRQFMQPLRPGSFVPLRWIDVTKRPRVREVISGDQVMVQPGGGCHVRSDHCAPCEGMFFYYEVQLNGALPVEADSAYIGLYCFLGTVRRIGPGSPARPDFASYHWDVTAQRPSGIRVSPPTSVHATWRTTFGSGDVMGLGVHHGTNEFFFVKNGVLDVQQSSRANERNATTFYPWLHVSKPKSPKSPMSFRVNFGERVFFPEVRPASLNFENPRTSSGRMTMAVQAQHPAPILSSYYFELTVAQVSAGLSIGFTDKPNFQGGIHPGKYEHSCGYHGDEGEVWVGGRRRRGCKFPRFRPGDKVGAGVVQSKNFIFFTHNGQMLQQPPGSASASAGHGHGRRSIRCFQEVFDTYEIYPTVGIRGNHDRDIQINFGDRPFSFNCDQI